MLKYRHLFPHTEKKKKGLKTIITKDIVLKCI